MAVLTKHFNVQAANIAVKDITINAAPKYVFVSHPSPWLDDNNNWNDNLIPVANLSIQSETGLYNEIVFGKCILDTDVIQMVPRYDWIAGTSYAKFSNFDANLYFKNFYVITDDRNVYKVIDNNYGSNSVVKPTVMSTQGTFYTSEGYIWKYMFTIPSNIYNKFTTNNYIPIVPNTSVIENAVPGTIDTINFLYFGWK